MECKNCEKQLVESDNYCQACGAKVIRNRLTLKNLFAHFSEQFLNYDNKFLNTFKALSLRPEEVIGGYIDGTRKKYVNAVNYFTIAVTISSLFFFVFLKFFPDALNFTSDLYNMDEDQARIMAEYNRSIFESQSLLFFISIPVLAVVSRLVFLKNKKYNFSEHLVINLYTYSHVSLSITALYFITIWYQPLFGVVAIVAVPFQIVFFAYVLKRLYKLSMLQILLKTMLFFVLLIPLIILLIIVSSIFMYFGGYFDKLLELEKAKRGLSYIASSAINWTS